MDTEPATRLAIIGASGRDEDGQRFANQPDMFLRRMVDAARTIASLTGARILVSGGAAWADHIAILLFLEEPMRFSLHLHLPAFLRADPRDPHSMEYLDSGADGGKSAAAVSNRLHREFHRQIAPLRPGWSPFRDLHTAFVHTSATNRLYRGFMPRNDAVAADADAVLAMTFGAGPQVKARSGTAYTMAAFLRSHDRSRAFHLDLSSMRLCRNATVAAP